MQAWGTRGLRTECVQLDPHPIVHAATEALLSRVGVSVTSTTSAAIALRAIYLRRPDLFLLEPLLPESGPLDGLDCIRLATRADGNVAVIAFSARDDEPFRAAVLREGATAFVSKTASLRTLEAVVADVLEGARCGDEPLTSVLTPREREILELVACHLTNDEVARELWLSRETVKFHLANVYRKLEVGGRAEAARWARRHGVVAETVVSGAAR